MIQRLLKHLLLFVAATTLAGCNDEPDDRRMDFVGDSIIARWDIAESFPAWQVYNYGRSGAGIDYLETLAGLCAGADAVVLIGTNNNDLMGPGTRADYARRYRDALGALGADHVYLYPVLPLDFGTNPGEANANIAAFNALIESEVADMPTVTYLNVYSRFLLNGKINPQLYNDGLHLSPYGYEILAEALKSAI